MNRLVMVLLLIFSGYLVRAQSFTSSKLSGVNLVSPTTLQFGPDSRLYVAQQDGTIFAYTIKKNGPGNYQVTSTETILLVKQIQNYNDDGSVNVAETNRQITGILTAGTPSNPILFVTSSDPRIGGGEGGGIGDVNLDTNSGVISKLTWNGSSWSKIDVVKGLSRSEENHSINGMQLDEANNILYLAAGGNTNAGSPSVNFTYITEYALSAAVLSIDLEMIENDFGGSYDLPTLDDPTRPNTGPGGSDVGDPFGGNDGLNQAKLVPGSPVQVYAPGYRNIYDLVFTKTAGIEGRLYTIDNGANAGWGGHPDNEGTANVTNNYVPGEPGSQGPGPNDDKVNNLDNLHLVSAPGFGPVYGGHPNPVRANPAGAGLYRRDDANQQYFELNPTTDWPPVPVNMANPVEGDFLNPGVDDGALYTWGSSTNGMAEYTATNFFEGEMAGDLLTASFDGSIYRIEFSPNGQSVTAVSVFASGFGSTPLDVTAQGTGEIFEGTVWAVTYVGENITVFEPNAGDEWIVEASNNNPTERHENAFVELDGLFYLIGGRGNKPLDIYNPVTQTWSTGAATPMEMHHFQAISYQGAIYVIGGFTGPYPDEQPLEHVYIYQPDTDTWTEGPAIPTDRLRGSAGVAVYNQKIYVVGGIQNGHIDGWVPWLDEFDPSTGTWTTLPDAPRARDHFQAAVLGDKLYAAGGRRTNENTLFTPTVAEVDVYDFNTGTWSTIPGGNIPTERAGAATVVIDGSIVVIGGETGAQTTAHDETEAFDPVSNTWTSLYPLNTGRHGTQALVYDEKIYIAAGSGNQGGGPELNSQEFLVFGTMECAGDPNSFNIDDDEDGYSNGDETLNGTQPCSAASRPADNDGDFLSDLLDDDDDNDGLLDHVDAFALDYANGESTSLPVDYPFLNGNPGFGLFGLGYTGLMTNNSNNYNELYDINNPGLIMGGASGVATLPASSGDATSNDQEYAFQFGVSVNSSTSAFTIRSALEGTPFFNGVFKDQSQGIYIGNGDQDNYLKLVLAANNGNGAFQILSESDGVQVVNTLHPVTNILSESEIILLMKVDPASGTVQMQYATGNAPAIDLGAPINLSGNLLNTLQGPDAVAVGLIATSGTAPSYQASWDFLEIDPDQVFQAIYKINSGGPAYIFEGESWQADQYNDANETYPLTPNPISIANTENDQLYQSEVNSSTGGFAYSLPVSNGSYMVVLHFAEIYHGVENGNGIGSRLFNVAIENGQAQLTNYDIIGESGAPATSVVETFSDISVTDGNLTITFTSVTDRAKVSGIEIFGTSAAKAPVVYNPGNQLLNPGENADIQIVATDPNPADVVTFSAVGLPPSLSLNSSTGQITGTFSDPNGNYSVTVRTSDGGGLFSETTFNIVASDFQLVYRINSGGPALSLDGQDWLEDQFNNGEAFMNIIPIANTVNDELYQTETFSHSGNFSYDIPVPANGTYAVRLHFAEIFHGIENNDGIGSRIFNMEIEGGQAHLTNFDIIAFAGAPATAISTAFSGIQVSDGIISIDFLASIDNPKLSGLEIFSATSTPFPPVVLQPADRSYDSGEQVFVQIVGEDPNIGDILSFSADGLPNSLSINPATGLISGTIADAPGEYAVTVRVSDESGLSDEKTFIISIVGYSGDIKVYPNPSDGNFNVQILFPDEENLSFSMIDNIGRQVPIGEYNLGGGKYRLEVSSGASITSGVYLLITNGTFIKANVTRVVIIR